MVGHGSLPSNLKGLKVVHLTSVHTAFDSRIFQKECRTLASAGCRVILIAPHDKHEMVDGVEIIPVPRKSNRFSRVMLTARKAVSVAAREKADIYHIHDPELLLWAGKLKKQEAVTLYDMHEDLPLQIRNKIWIPKTFRYLASWAAKNFEKVLIGGLPVVMAESSYQRNRSWLTNRITVLNFPRLDWLKELTFDRRQNPRPKVGYIGAVTKERGSMAMLDALGLLSKKGVKIDFECIGPVSAEHRLELEAKVSSLNLPGVSIVGYMPPREGWSRVAGCDMGIALLEPIPNYLESYPTKMFEYMGMGLPVVVSDFPLYQEIIDRTGCGFAVDPLDAEAIAQAITFLVENPDQAVEMGQKGQDFALSEFNWESEKTKLLNFYGSLVQG